MIVIMIIITMMSFIIIIIIRVMIGTLFGSARVAVLFKLGEDDIRGALHVADLAHALEAGRGEVEERLELGDVADGVVLCDRDGDPLLVLEEDFHVVEHGDVHGGEVLLGLLVERGGEGARRAARERLADLDELVDGVEDLQKRVDLEGRQVERVEQQRDAALRLLPHVLADLHQRVLDLRVLARAALDVRARLVVAVPAADAPVDEHDVAVDLQQVAEARHEVVGVQALAQLAELHALEQLGAGVGLQHVGVDDVLAVGLDGAQEVALHLVVHAVGLAEQAEGGDDLLVLVGAEVPAHVHQRVVQPVLHHHHRVLQHVRQAPDRHEVLEQRQRALRLQADVDRARKVANVHRLAQLGLGVAQRFDGDGVVQHSADQHPLALQRQQLQGLLQQRPLGVADVLSPITAQTRCQSKVIS